MTQRYMYHLATALNCADGNRTVDGGNVRPAKQLSDGLEIATYFTLLTRMR